MKSLMITKGRFARSEPAAKSARTFALLVLGLALSGCTSIGVPAYQAFVDGNYQQAYAESAVDYRNHPDSSIAQINMADSYRRNGETDKANALFHDAALSGKGVHPDGMTEPHDSNTTIADVACRYLAEAHQSDANCPTLVAASD